MKRDKHQNARELAEQAIAEAIARAEKEGKPLALLALDIDQFARVNNTYGHDVGDIVLDDIARIIQGQIGDSGTLSRWGGDEYVILVPGAPLSEAQALAEGIRKAVEAHEFPQAGRVTVTLGVAAHQAGDSPAALMARADKAIYRAKLDGGNQVLVVS
jgi:diguanylate cyclase (GGDEF)-like protein